MPKIFDEIWIGISASFFISLPKNRKIYLVMIWSLPADGFDCGLTTTISVFVFELFMTLVFIDLVFFYANLPSSGFSLRLRYAPSTTELSFDVYWNANVEGKMRLSAPESNARRNFVWKISRFYSHFSLFLFLFRFFVLFCVDQTGETAVYPTYKIDFTMLSTAALVRELVWFF